jgi:predicted permease
MPEPQELADEAALRRGTRRLLRRQAGTLGWRSDLTHAIRQVRHAPAFAAIFAATIALGLGASLTVFMVIDHVFVQPLDVPDASRLVVLQRVAPFATLGVDTYSSDTWTREVYQKLSSASTVTLAASDVSDPLRVDLGGDTQQPRSMFITAGYLDLLGMTPALGRAFLPSDDQEGAPVTAILSHALWQTHFGGDRTVLGRVIRVNGSLVEVVGIAPRTFRGTTLDARALDLLLPFAARAQLTPESVFLPRVRVVGRLAPGATVEQASAQITAIVERDWPRKVPTDPPRARALPLRDAVVPPDVQADLRWFLTLLTAAIGLTVAIGCTNLTTLLLARVDARRGEFALRSVLGATRGGLARQLVVETAVLAFAGGIGALVVARVIVRSLSAFALPGGVALSALGDGRVGRTLGVAAILTLIVASTVSLVPMLRATRHGLIGDVGQLRDGAARRTTHVLVGLQVAICVVLVFGAGLFVRSLSAMLSDDVGFDPRGLVSASIAVPWSTTQQRGPLIDALVARLRERPEVVGVAVGPMPLAQGSNMSTATIQIDGVPVEIPTPLEVAFPGPGYFATLGQQMAAGRDFTDVDAARADSLAIVNESAARALWGAGNPLGRQIGYNQFAASSNDVYTVIGVVRDAMVKGIGDRRPVLYVLRSSRPGRVDFWAATMSNAMFLTARTRGEPAILAEPLRRAAADLGLAVTSVTPLETVVDELVRPQRLGRALLTGLGVMALVVTLVGIYGSVSGAVTRRSRDAGIRLALGASRVSVATSTVKPTLAVVALGLVLGAVSASGSGRFVERFLYGVDSSDPGTLALVLLLMGTIAAAAAIVPTVRLFRIDPAEALRVDH